MIIQKCTVLYMQTKQITILMLTKHANYCTVCTVLYLNSWLSTLNLFSCSRRSSCKSFMSFFKSCTSWLRTRKASDGENDEEEDGEDDKEDNEDEDEEFDDEGGDEDNGNKGGKHEDEDDNTFVTHVKNSSSPSLFPS